MVFNQKSYASILKQNSIPPPQPKDYTFSFSADQLIKFVATVAIQITQLQVCHSNVPKDAVDKKSSLCRRVSDANKSQLGSLEVPCLTPLVVFAPQCSLPPKFQSSYQNPSDFLVPPNHQPCLTLSAPLPLLTRLSPKSSK